MSNMFSKITLAAAAVALTASFSSLALPRQAGAAESGKAKDAVVSAAAPKDETEKTLLKLSQDGFNAMRFVRAARVSLFNGKTEQVSERLKDARTALESAEKEAPSFAVKVSESINGKSAGTESETEKADVIPIDASIAVADDYVLTNEKKAHIAKANEHFKKGQSREAMEELRLAEVDLNYTRTLMPLNSTMKHVDQAIKLLGEHKYYEANLALKAAEDGLTIETVNLMEPVGKHASAPARPGAK